MASHFPKTIEYELMDDYLLAGPKPNKNFLYIQHLGGDTMKNV